MKFSLFATLAFMMCCPCRAQKQHDIVFNSDGRIISNLPEKIFTNDNLSFKIESKETFEKFNVSLQDRLKASKKNIDKIQNDADKLKLLSELFDISKTELDAVAAQITMVTGNTYATFAAGSPQYVPVYTPSDKAYYSFKFNNLATNGDATLSPGNTINVTAALTGDERQLDFALNRYDPFKKLVFNWLASTKADYDPDPVNFSKLQKDKDDLNKLLDDIRKFALDAKAFLSDGLGRRRQLIPMDVPRLKQIIQDATKFKVQVVALQAKLTADLHFCFKPYKGWMLKWLWYQNSTALPVNPFNFKRPGELNAISDTSELSGLRVSISVRQSLLEDEKFIKNAKLSDIDGVIHTTDSLKKRVIAIQRAYRNDSVLNATNLASIADFGKTSALSNKGILYVGKDNNSYWMRNHDASQLNQLMTGDVADEYIESSRVVIIEHNLLVNENAESHLSFQTITDDQSVLSEQVRIAIAMLGDAKKLTLIPAAGGPKASRVEDDPAVLAKQAGTAVNSLEQEVTKLDRGITVKCLDYTLAQNNPVFDIKEDVDESKGYHSKIITPAKKIDGPQKAIYFITKIPSPPAGSPTVVPDTFTYRVNKLYRLFPMAGLNYTVSQFTDISYDADHKQFKTKEQIHARFVIGMKVFLRKTDIRNTKFISQEDENGRALFLSRTSINVAFDASTPKDNFYTGLGFDFWPGFCLNTGAVFNRYTYNQYVDNVNVKTQTLYRPGFYVGISTDVALFADVVKLLNFSK